MTSTEIVRDLRSTGAYPWRSDSVELVETHISWVFLAGDRVIKIKRPVDLGFVDHTTLEARHRSCDDEVRLNARLTEDVYLGVVPITRDGDAYVVQGDGEPVEWATLMRRLPANRMLDALLASGSVPDRFAERIGDRLVPFHRDAAPCEGTPQQQADESTDVVIDNLDELQRLMRDRPFGTELSLIDAAVRAFITTHQHLLLERARDGWIRDGHGDLRAEHVCLETDGRVQIFDCVEFNSEIRCDDIVSDLAFLLMDLDRLGVAREYLHVILERYRQAGLELPPHLLGLYWIHRALVRAKVDAIRMTESEEDDDSAMLGDVVTYLHNAAQHAIACSPVVIVMTGVSGTGKSTVARQLAGVLNADHHRSDVVRKTLAEAEQDGDDPDGWQAGIYGEDWTRATYNRLLELGGVSIDSGRPVILDATFLEREWRDAAAALAREHDVPMLLVETVTDDAVLERRLEERSVRNDDPSDADVTIMRRQRSRLAENPPGVPRGALAATIDTTPEGYVDLDPVLLVLRDADVIASRLDGIG